jgi:hypothetical protein
VVRVVHFADCKNQLQKNIALNRGVKVKTLTITMAKTSHKKTTYIRKNKTYISG